MVAIALMALAACESGAAKECDASGGRWIGPVGMGELACSRPASDKGKACKDSSECEGDCVVDDEVTPGTRATGRCSDSTSNLGRCLNFVEKGEARGVMCLE